MVQRAMGTDKFNFLAVIIAMLKGLIFGALSCIKYFWSCYLGGVYVVVDNINTLAKNNIGHFWVASVSFSDTVFCLSYLTGST